MLGRMASTVGQCHMRILTFESAVAMALYVWMSLNGSVRDQHRSAAILIGARKAVLKYPQGILR